jgi:AP endonuclease-1
MPLILETPCDRIDPSDPTGKKTIEDKGTWAREIKLLESLIGMDPESDEFKNLEQELSEKGRASREKMQDAIDQKNKKAKKTPEKGQRSLVDMMGKKDKKKNKMKMESTENSSLSNDEEVDE